MLIAVREEKGSIRKQNWNSKEKINKNIGKKIKKLKRNRIKNKEESKMSQY